MVKVRITRPDRVYAEGRLLPLGYTLEIPEKLARVWVEQFEVAEYVEPPEARETKVEGPTETKEEAQAKRKRK
ncbi:hypothetical protein BSNK01_28300 [Bacillaceae bacterium]